MAEWKWQWNEKTKKVKKETAKLLESIYCTTATSALDERVFGQSGLLMRLHRPRLGDKPQSELPSCKCNEHLLSNKPNAHCICNAKYLLHLTTGANEFRVMHIQFSRFVKFAWMYLPSIYSIFTTFTCIFLSQPVSVSVLVVSVSVLINQVLTISLALSECRRRAGYQLQAWYPYLKQQNSWKWLEFCLQRHSYYHYRVENFN